jgi:hypothetical protein
MKVGILTSVHPPTDTRILFKQAVTLVQGGHEVWLVARAGKSAVGCGVHHVVLPVPNRRLARLGTCWLLLRAALRLRCDVYHLHDPELLPIGVVLKLLTRAALVFDVHEDVRRQIRKQVLDSTPASPAAGGCLRNRGATLSAADRPRRDRRGFLRSRVPRSRPRGDPQLSDARSPAAVSLPGSIRRSTRGIPSSCIAVPSRGFVGHGDAGSGAATRAEVPRRASDAHRLLLPGNLEQEIRDKVRSLRIEAHVTLRGRMPLDEAMQVVAGCDVGLAILHPDPNYLQSLPTKMFEYMALRLPVVVSDFGLWRGIVEGTAAGRPSIRLRPADIAAAIDRIVADSQRLTAMGESGCRAVREIYSWEAKAGACWRCNRELGADGAPPSPDATSRPDASRDVAKPPVTAQRELEPSHAGGEA